MKSPSVPAPRKEFRGTGRMLERFVWQFRSYLIPSHILTYLEIVRRHGFAPEIAARKFICFDFTKIDMDADVGRYAFFLVREFETLGYLVCYRKNFRFLATMKHKAYKRLLLDRPFCVCNSVGELPQGSVVAEVTDRSAPPRNETCRQILIRYDRTWPQSEQEVPMPFFVHPMNYDRCLAASPPDLVARRPWRIFFAGSAARDRYGSSVYHATFGKMSRVQILDTLEAGLPADRVWRIQSAADLHQDDAQHARFARTKQDGHRIPDAEWLDVLERADFFLACPGVEMPLCHNLIEALARGTVPILEHPEFLDPPLEHNVNCLVFHGPDELLQTFTKAFQSSPGEINRLRQGAFTYYEKYLSPGKFAQRLLDQPDQRMEILLNACQSPPPAKPLPRHARR
jgi:hypothetical protein